MLDKLNLRRKKAVKVQKSVSSDKRVDYHEWHKDLKRSVTIVVVTIVIIFIIITFIVIINLSIMLLCNPCTLFIY